MNIYLVGINAHYIHTSLSIRSIASYSRMHAGIHPILGEYTINQHDHDILEDLYDQQADVYLFSCYIWNIDMVRRLTSQLAKIRPEAKIFLGGPEATYKAQELLEDLPFVHGIVLGEGEVTVAELMVALQNGQPIDAIAGMHYASGPTAPRPPMSMDLLPFAYHDLDQLENKILYYESMRGCPFSCSYCLSSVEKGVQMRSVGGVEADLTRFLLARPQQVKFVDRTFNCNLARAKQIWEFLIANDNGVTNFHFELAGDLLDEEALELLSTARPNLFQFEIGIQSTNPKTIDAINRTTNLEKLAYHVERLQEWQNIHLHLDLIAGLPYEDFHSFVRSFHWVYALDPHQFQLGFLKVLGGSQMEAQAEEFGLLYQDDPPFQVLSTRWISYEELTLLEGVADMVDTYRNSGRYTYLLQAFVPLFDTPFDFYHALYLHYREVKGQGPLSKIGYYQLFGSLAEKHGLEITDKMKAACRYDLMLHEKPGRVPVWAQRRPTANERQWVQDFYQDDARMDQYYPEYHGESPSRLPRITHTALFHHNPATGKPVATAAILDYRVRDILGRAKVTLLELPNFTP